MDFGGCRRKNAFIVLMGRPAAASLPRRGYCAQCICNRRVDRQNSETFESYRQFAAQPFFKRRQRLFASRQTFLIRIAVISASVITPDEGAMLHRWTPSTR